MPRPHRCQVIIRKSFDHTELTGLCELYALHWRHNDHSSVSNHQPHGCLLNRIFRRRSKNTSKLRVAGVCKGSSPGPVNSPHKGPVTRKMFPFDDVIMAISFSRHKGKCKYIIISFNEFNMKMPFFLFLSLINMHYIVPRYIENTVLWLPNSRNTITSITSNTHIDYWSHVRPINPCCWCSVWDGGGKVNGDEDVRCWSINRSLVLFCPRKLCSNYLKMVAMNKYATLWI